ncbi:MAG: hypothetical protein Q4G69_05035 [Planctomycetia bacterium]|nr:hypothetical protein [Planctomycetia bacterium]
MKFMVGYQADEHLKETILRYREAIAEIYFPWIGFTSGRGMVAGYEAQCRMESDLDDYTRAGIGMNLLLNGNCYGRRSQSRIFFQSIGDTVENLCERYHLGSITTASPLIAKFLKENFPDLEIRASVNMEIGTSVGMDYLADLFDGFYLKREYNKDLARIQANRKWCSDHNKKLYLLANSGCLNFCSARTFHDNLVAHQHEIAEMDNGYEFHGICHSYLANPEKRKSFLQITNFIRPEDLAKIEDYFDGIKLATRTNRNPAAVVKAYAERHYIGNLLDLTEPNHAGHFYPEILANDRIPNDYADRVLSCDKNCDQCGYCADILRSALIRLDEGSVFNKE